MDLNTLKAFQAVTSNDEARAALNFVKVDVCGAGFSLSATNGRVLLYKEFYDEDWLKFRSIMRTNYSFALPDDIAEGWLSIDAKKNKKHNIFFFNPLETSPPDVLGVFGDFPPAVPMYVKSDAIEPAENAPQPSYSFETQALISKIYKLIDYSCECFFPQENLAVDGTVSRNCWGEFVLVVCSYRQ